MARPVLIDTDAGIDDALAIILALRSPEITVKAITTVAGNVEVEQCTRNVGRILDLMRVGERPIVAQGARKPLKKPLVTAPEVHGNDGLGNVIGSFGSGYVRSNAADVILSLCKRHGRRLTIIALGPLTNLALALKRNPKIFKRVGKVVSMGGAFRVPGNTGPVAEFNYFVDPDAAQLLLRSGVPLTLVPLDVTEQVVLMRTELLYRAKRRANELSKFVARFTDHYMRYHRRTEGFYGGYLHDPITVAVAVRPSLFAARNVHVDVETQGKLTRGMTIADFRQPPSVKGGSIRVVTKIDRDGFLSFFHEKLWK